MKVSVDGKMLGVKIKRNFELTDLAFADNIVTISGDQDHLSAILYPGNSKNFL